MLIASHFEKPFIFRVTLLRRFIYLTYVLLCESFKGSTN